MVKNKAYDFNENTMEYSAKQKKKIPVWQSPKYDQSKEKACEIIGKYDSITSADFWILMNETKTGKMAYTGLIISHNGCLKLNDELPQDMRFKPSCMSLDKDGYGHSLVYTYINDDQGIYEVGEVSQANCKNSYVYAMALKRCFDRVVLKTSKLAYNGVYSDSEADEFKERYDDAEPPKTPQAAEPDREAIVNQVKEREMWRGKMLEAALERNISKKELAEDYELSLDTTAERFKEIYEDLISNK